jgi:site-specific DNA recombinase
VLFNCVVVYKVDRLSRSLLDFARMMELFDQYQVAFVSVTQQFNTASSMGRLVLNVLLSFAQFEREIISERTRDKIAAARRKGKWAGGHPILGYDIDTRGFKLVVNAAEARRVRAIFNLYLKHQALIPLVEELERRGWRNKRWTTRKGRVTGGRLFNKTSLHHLLRNVAYVGRVKYKHETHPGEHPGIVDVTVFERVQALLKDGRPEPSAIPRRKSHAMLQGLIRCAPCGCAMVSSRTTRNKTRQYRYYVCSSAQQRGWKTCPSKSIPAGTIEQFVVDQIRTLGQDAEVRAQVLASGNGIKAADLDRALDAFDHMWSTSTPTHQAETIHRVVERVAYDGANKTVSLTLKPTGLQSLIAELNPSNGVRS